MKYEINTSITIHATPAQIWDVLTDFSAYPTWNSFIKSIRGEISVGKKFHVEIEGMKFNPVTLTFEQNRSFSWKGILLFPGLFDGTHAFELTDNDNGTTTFVQKESFKGILVGFLKKKLDKDTRSGFEAMNRNLKETVESRLTNTSLDKK